MCRRMLNFQNEKPVISSTGVVHSSVGARGNGFKERHTTPGSGKRSVAEPASVTATSCLDPAVGLLVNVAGQVPVRSCQMPCGRCSGGHGYLPGAPFVRQDAGMHAGRCSSQAS